MRNPPDPMDVIKNINITKNLLLKMIYGTYAPDSSFFGSFSDPLPGVFYFPIKISAASFSVLSSPTLPGKITYGVCGNLLSSPVCHTGIPGRICPSTLALCTASALVPTSEEVMPALGDHETWHMVSRPTSDCTASEMRTASRRSSSYLRYLP